MIIKRGLITLIIFIISISITSATNCYGIDPVTLLDNGLVVHYSMDSADKSGNIMKDLSGNNRDGQIYNNATTDPDSVFGESIFFDGDDHQGGFIEVLNSEGIHPDQFTLSIWFKTGDNYTVVEDDLDGWDFLFGNTIQGVGWRYGYGIYFLKSENELRFFVSHFEHSYVSTHFDWDNDKGWHHVVGSYDGQVIKMYLDGLLADTFSFSGPVEKTTDSIRVGANYYWNGDRWFFDGLVDDARMYDRALSESEVAALYNWDVNITTGPEITSPTPNSVLTDTTVTFAWTAGTTPVTAWWLYVGSSAGSQDILDSGSLGTSTSVPVSGLPCDGSTVYVRLWYETGGSQYLDYQYTASSSCTATGPDIITDSDGDGYTEDQGDCNDSDASIKPGATEICGDGVDQDCNGSDLDCAPDSNNVDDDGDGFTENQGDCNDNNIAINPGVIDSSCDNVDNNCNSIADESYVPLPTACGTGECSGNTGQLECQSGEQVNTCDPLLGATTETCDNLDNDCDGEIDEGVTNACGSCGAVPNDVCDGKDNDCNGLVDDTDIACTSVNNPPSVPQLLYPSYGLVELGTTIEFKWEKSSDPDGDDVTYNPYVCEDTNFSIGCITKENIASQAIKKYYFAGSGLSLLIFGLTFFGKRSNRQNIMLALILLITPILFILSCGNGDDAGNILPQGNNSISQYISGLKADTTYYWKVVADDGRGGISQSEVRSFTTKNN